MVSKVFEKLVNNTIVDNLEKVGFFSDFQYGFRSFRSTADLLTVVSDRIPRLLAGLGLLKLQHLIYPRLLIEFGMLVFFTKLDLMKFQARYLTLFLLFSVIGDFRRRGKSSEEYLVNAGVLKGPLLVLHFSCID